MPELPEVETVRRGLAAVLADARIETVALRRAGLRIPFPEHFAERLVGRRVGALSRRAKYILAPLDSGETLIVHLGMSGSFRIDHGAEQTPGAFHFARSKSAAHDHVVLGLSNGARVTYNDPRRFGLMQLAPSDGLADHPLFRRLGAEPLAADFDAAAMARLLAGRKTPLKAALLDQSLVAGLGNIYVCEALHRAALSPRARGGRARDEGRRPDRRGEAARGGDPRGARRSGRGGRLDTCATIARPTANSAISSIPSSLTARKAPPASARAARGRSPGSSRRGARRSIARCVSGREVRSRLRPGRSGESPPPWMNNSQHRRGDASASKGELRVNCARHGSLWAKEAARFLNSAPVGVFDQVPNEFKQAGSVITSERASMRSCVPHVG